MSELSDRPESDSESSLHGTDDAAEDSFGWDDESGYEQSPFEAESKVLIDRANKSHKLSDVFKKYKIKLEDRWASNGWTKYCCCPFPDHNDDTPSFGYNPKRDAFHCLGCSRGGKVVEFLSIMEGQSKVQIARRLVGGISLPEIIEEVMEDEHEKIGKLLFDFAISVREFVYTHGNSRAAVEYSERVSVSLDMYYRDQYLRRGSIVNIEHLDARIKRLKQYFDAFEE